jgi:hypothetical protein
MFYNRVGFGKTLNSQVDPLPSANIFRLLHGPIVFGISEAARYVGQCSQRSSHA